VDSIVDTFSHVSLEKFNFLVTEFAYKSVVKKKGTASVSRVIFRNATTAVEIGLEWREQYVYVEVYRLVDGKMEENPIVIHPESELTAFNLEDLVAVRAQGLQLISQSPGTPLTRHDIEKILNDRAVALRKYGRDVLQGDFRVFRKLERIVKSRLSAYQRSDGAVVQRAKASPANRVSRRPDERGNVR
jgi:hypothetical protein